MDRASLGDCALVFATRLRSLGLAFAVALVLLLATRQLGCHAYSANGAYRAQVDAFLDGRLALSRSADALAHDLAWTPSGVQQVWGLGVPLWQTPFELAARLIGQDPFPDRVALLVWLTLGWFVLLRAFRRPGEPWWVGGGAVLITALLPAFVTMVRGRMGVYEEAAVYAYTAALILLGGLVAFARAPSRTRFLVLLAAAGLTGLVRPTVWFYGLGTAVLATAIYLRAEGRRVLPTVALGLALFVAGGAALYATNAARFGAGSEFGHKQNLEALPGNVVATRFSYPFERTGWIEASVELAGSVFGRPEQAGKKGFYAKDLHAGQSDVVRWREYYFTTFSWAYLPLLLAGLVLGALGWRRRQSETASDDARGGDTDRWLGAWAVIGALPLAVFYLHSPSISSRYELDLAPGIAALLVIAWHGGVRWMIARKRGVIAPALLLALWILALVTSKTRGRVAGDLVDRETAAAARANLSRVVPRTHELPASYDLADPKLESWLDADGKPPELYLNGSGWDRTTGRVAPAIHLFMTDPELVEVEVETPTGAQVEWSTKVRVAIGLTHLTLAGVEPTPRGARLRFELPAPLPGLQVAFLAFGPDTELDLPQSNLVLRRVRWR
ncbi:MAG: hypothetical protein IPQ07_40835 [Myxococcales bacterium]|nr:hypothetical protein [Myxococcales bacterium]